MDRDVPPNLLLSWAHLVALEAIARLERVVGIVMGVMGILEPLLAVELLVVEIALVLILASQMEDVKLLSKHLKDILEQLRDHVFPRILVDLVLEHPALAEIVRQNAEERMAKHLRKMLIFDFKLPSRLYTLESCINSDKNE